MKLLVHYARAHKDLDPAWGLKHPPGPLYVWQGPSGGTQELRWQEPRIGNCSESNPGTGLPTGSVPICDLTARPSIRPQSVFEVCCRHLFICMCVYVFTG